MTPARDFRWFPSRADEALCGIIRPEAEAAATWAGLDLEDARRVVRRALELGVAVLLYSRLKASGVAVGENAGLAPLRRRYLQCAARNMGVAVQLGRVLDGLRARGVEVMVLKGVYLAESLYGDWGARTTSDIDLLAKRPDYPEIEAALKELGYVPARRYHPNAEYIVFLHRKALPAVDLHFNLGGDQGFARDGDGVWRRARPAEAGGVEMRVPGTEDLVLGLIQHSAHHRVFSLRAAADLAWAMHRLQKVADWTVLSGRAEATGLEPALMLGLGLTQGLMEVRLPEAVQERIHRVQDNPKFCAALAAAVEQVFTPGRWLVPMGPEPLAELAGTGWGRKAGVTLRRVLLPRWQMEQMFGLKPGSLWVFPLYGYRMAELAWRGAGWLVRRMIPAGARREESARLRAYRAVRGWVESGT